MKFKEFDRRLQEISEQALEAHELTAAAMILEQAADEAELLYTLGNTRRRNCWIQLVQLNKDRLEGSGKASDWTRLTKRERKCFDLAHELNFASMLIEDFLHLRGSEDEFAPELDGLQDQVTTKEFELQYNLIKFVKKGRRGW